MDESVEVFPLIRLYAPATVPRNFANKQSERTESTAPSVAQPATASGAQEALASPRSLPLEPAAKMADAAPFILLDQALMSEHPDTELGRLEQTGLLGELFPEVSAMIGFGGEDQGHKDLWQHTKQVVRQTVRKLEVRWAALFHDVGKVQTFSRENGKVTFHAHEIVSARIFNRAARRAKMDTARRKHIKFLVRYLGYVESYSSDWTDSAVRRVHREMGEHFADLLSLARADITTRHAYKRRQHQERMDELEQRALTIAREDAKLPPLPKGLGNLIISDLGVPPGPRIGELMEVLKAAIEAGELPARAECPVYIDYLKSKG